MISYSQPDALWRDRVKRLNAINREAWKLTDVAKTRDTSGMIRTLIRH